MPQSEHFYQLPTEMLEGNAFIRVSLSFCLIKGGSHVTIIHDALDLTEQAHLRLFHYKAILMQSCFYEVVLVPKHIDFFFIQGCAGIQIITIQAKPQIKNYFSLHPRT